MIINYRLCTIFAVGWLSYAATYLLRKPLGIIKPNLQTDLKLSNAELGYLDTALLLPYAIIQIFCSSSADRYGSKLTYSLGLLIAGLSMLPFGLSTNYLQLIIMLFVNGAAQSLLWPTANKCLGTWVNDKNRSFVFGMFGTCPFLGGIVATVIATYIQSQYGWRMTHYVPAILVISCAFLSFVFFYDNVQHSINTKSDGNTNEYSLKNIWNIPCVKETAIAVLCLKAVRYIIYMWLPIYFFQQLDYSMEEAGYFSTSFEWGGIVGTFLIGVTVDRLFKGNGMKAATYQTFLSAVALFFFNLTSTNGYVTNLSMMAIIGLLNCAADIILAGPIPTELGSMNGRNCGAATVGVVNGVGSIGTIIEGPLVGYISTVFGWTGLFYFMIIVTIIGGIASYRATRIYMLLKQRQTITALP
ncbi:hypothetical protein SNEBB_001687 [Seison nebaliae]|nr:hypothetical protein SNEBB_001687 [Seison nebaliae]